MTDISKQEKIKRTRNAARTRGLILEKAADIFAEKGYEGTALSEIVRDAGVTKRMIYHYYGDKRGLYRAIFIHEWGLLKEWYDRALQRRMAEGGSVDTKELSAQSVGIFFDFLAERPQFVRLMMWEGLEGGEISQSIWKDIRGPLYVQMEFLIQQAQQEGLLDANLDAAHFVVTFLGAISFYFGYAPTLVDMLHEEPFSKAALEKRKFQILRLLANLYEK
jgi:AcrR family transcriptional regulator